MNTHAIDSRRAVYPAASILIVDDEPSNLRVLERIFRRAGYADVRATTDPLRVLPLCVQAMPDVVLLDLHMPAKHGVELMRELQELAGHDYPEILVLTGDASRDTKSRALSSGARDFLSKPFDLTEVLLRIHNLIDLRMLHRELRQKNDLLEQRVAQRTQELDEARMEIIERLGLAAEFRDDDTGQHTRRVGYASGLLAQAIALPPATVELIACAAPLHDVGKIAIPDQILLKPGPLTSEETEVMRTHTVVGARLLSRSVSPLLDLARDIALTHHERWDGDGYPQGQTGVEIPLAGRIVALADFFDALTHDRPYRARRDVRDVVALIELERGRHFDPDLADAFLEVIARHPEIHAHQMDCV